MPDLSKTHLEELGKIYQRYHHEMKELPIQVYFDVGYLLGVIKWLSGECTWEQKNGPKGG